MIPLSKDSLEATTPSTLEAFLGKIPFLGWTFAHAIQNNRFHPIVTEFKRVLMSRDRDDANEEWDPGQRSDATRLMRIFEEEMGWEPPTFIPSDPCRVAFWAHADGLDDVAAVQRIEREWGIDFSDEEIAKIWDCELQTFIALIQTKCQQVINRNVRSNP